MPETNLEILKLLTNTDLGLLIVGFLLFCAVIIQGIRMYWEYQLRKSKLLPNTTTNTNGQINGAYTQIVEHRKMTAEYVTQIREGMKTHSESLREQTSILRAISDTQNHIAGLQEQMVSLLKECLNKS